MRILVAEDERVTRASLVRQLQKWGHDVTAAEDGQCAWELFRSTPFDVVLTDWEMPRLSGLEFIERIRATDDAGFVYVLLLTGRSDKADVVRGIEAGADDFVAKPFDPDELRVRLLAGERIVRLERTLSVQNAELRRAGERVRHDLRAASRVQRSMLPHQTVVSPYVRTAWTYVPADELGGDALGIHLIDDRFLVFYVADVSGHGVPAALLAVTAMHQLRDLCSGPTGTVCVPAQIATEINRRFTSSEQDGRFFTMVFCVLDMQTGRMTFTSAGHPPPLVVRHGQVVPVAPAGGVPIGLMPDASYDDGAIDLLPGDRVYLVSDGILEQFEGPGAEQFGVERLAALLCAPREEGPADAILRAVETLAKWSQSATFTDDVSLLAVEWCGSPSPSHTLPLSLGSQSPCTPR